MEEKYRKEDSLTPERVVAVAVAVAEASDYWNMAVVGSPHLSHICYCMKSVTVVCIYRCTYLSGLKKLWRRAFEVEATTGLGCDFKMEKGIRQRSKGGRKERKEC